MDTSQVHNPLSHEGNFPWIYLLNEIPQVIREYGQIEQQVRGALSSCISFFLSRNWPFFLQRKHINISEAKRHTGMALGTCPSGHLLGILFFEKCGICWILYMLSDVRQKKWEKGSGGLSLTRKEAVVPGEVSKTLGESEPFPDSLWGPDTSVMGFRF